MNEEIEIRSYGQVEIRATEDGAPPRLVGRAAMFERESEDLGGFVEIIQAGAFKRSLEKGDIRYLWNHDSNLILGRTPRTLRLHEDETGLAFELDLPDTQAGRDALVTIQRGDVTGMSFGFRTPKGGDSWSKKADGMAVRRLLSVELLEISSVPFPAYPDSHVAVRSKKRWLAETWQPSTAHLRRRLELLDGA